MSVPGSRNRIAARFHLQRPGFLLDVDLDLPGHGVIAVFGHSGSGKTTLLRCMAGLERKASGRLSVAGETWQDSDRFLPAYRRKLGYVFQEASLFPHLSVRGNLQYGLKRAVNGGRAISLDQVIDLLGISPLLERRPEGLSGGERHRVAIARALTVNPQILLMDEPLAGLDMARKQEILPYLERLRDELAIPILYVSHSPDEVARLADHIVVLEGGRAVVGGPLGETLARLDLPIQLGEDVGVVIDAVIGARDEPWHLIRADFPGGELWTRDTGLPIGHHTRVRILARDVSLSHERQHQTSIVNLLPAVVTAIADDYHPALALVRVDAAGTAILSRVTKRSAAALKLNPGRPVWLQVKAVALIG